MKGIYNLVLKCNKNLNIGSIGKKELDGTYTYIGSAQGPGGIEKRINRHLALSQGKKEVKHWHIDYVLPHCDFLGYCYGETDKNKECELAKKIKKQEKIKDFGCSDCSCESHFFKINKPYLNEIKKVYEKLNILPKCNFGINHQVSPATEE